LCTWAIEAGSDRRPELDEMMLELAAESFLDGRLRLGHGKRRQPVLQVSQIARDRGPDDVGSRGQELAELDIARAQ